MVGGYVHRWVGGSVFLKKDRKKEREVRNKERKGGEMVEEDMCTGSVLL